MAGDHCGGNMLLFPIITGSDQEIWGHVTPFVFDSRECSTRSDLFWQEEISKSLQDNLNCILGFY